MNQLFHILNIKIKSLNNSFIFIKDESKLKISFILFFIFGYFIFGGIFIYKSFVFALHFPIIGDLLIERSFYVYFFIIFVMLTISSFVLSISNLFSSKETEYLMLQPIKTWKIYLIKFFETCFAASWAFIFLSIPIYIAYGIVLKIKLFSYIISAILILFPFVIITSAIGFICAICAVRYLFNFKGILLIISLITGLILKFLFYFQNKTDYMYSDVKDIFQNLLKHTEWTISPYFPSKWLTELFFSISNNFNNNFFLYFNLLLSLSLILFLLTLIISIHFGFDTWSKYNSSGSSKKSFSLFNFLYNNFINKNNLLAIIFKDLQLFIRDPIQFSQFGIFFGLLFIYVYNLKNMHYDQNSIFWKSMITFLNLGSTSLTLGTLSTRFFYPQISLEGKAIWILGMSPIKKQNIVLIKFYYTCFISILISLILIHTSNVMLNINGYFYYLTISIALIQAITLSGIAIGFGAIFPNFSASSSAHIVSGFGGTLTLIISMIYVTLTTGIPALIQHLFTINTISKNQFFIFNIIYFVLLLGISIFSIFYLLKKGIQNIEKDIQIS